MEVYIKSTTLSDMAMRKRRLRIFRAILIAAIGFLLIGNTLNDLARYFDNTDKVRLYVVGAQFGLILLFVGGGAITYLILGRKLAKELTQDIGIDNSSVRRAYLKKVCKPNCKCTTHSC